MVESKVKDGLTTETTHSFPLCEFRKRQHLGANTAPPRFQPLTPAPRDEHPRLCGCTQSCLLPISIPSSSSSCVWTVGLNKGPQSSHADQEFDIGRCEI